MGETIEAFGTELEVEQTDNGFGVSEVEDDDGRSSVYITGGAGPVGFKVPIDSEFELESLSDGYLVAFNTDVNKSDKRTYGDHRAKSDNPNLDGHVWVGGIEIVE